MLLLLDWFSTFAIHYYIAHSFGSWADHESRTKETLPPVDMTSFLSLTDAGGMKATDAADALREAAKGDPGPRKTWTTAVQTSTPEVQEDL